MIWKSEEEQLAKPAEDRPHVILNAAMTLDGKIATAAKNSTISCQDDLMRMHKLRANVDAVMIGIGTALTDNPQLTAHGEGRNPVRVLIDSKARIPSDAHVLMEKTGRGTIIAVTEKAPKESIERLRSAGAEVTIAGSDNQVEPRLLMKELRKKGICTLMLEGGGTLNWSMLKEGLVDEVCVAIAPTIVGGRNAATLVEGEGFSRIEEGIKLKLKLIERCGEDLVLTYEVLGLQHNRSNVTT